MKHFAHHMTHYLSLFGVLAMGLIAFIIFPHDGILQQAVSVAVAASYVAWGIIHHYLHNDLHASVVIEYIVVAILGLVVVFSLIIRA